MNANVRKFLKRALVLGIGMAVIILDLDRGDNTIIGRTIVAMSGDKIRMPLVVTIWLVFAISAIIWMIRPLFRRKSSRNDIATKISSLIISLTVSASIILLPSQATAGEQIVVKDTQSATVKAGSVVVTIEGGENLTASEQQAISGYIANQLVVNGGLIGPNVTILGGIVIVVVTVAVIYGVYYITVKIIEALDSLGKKTKKQLEDDDGGTNTSSSVLSSQIKTLNAAGDIQEYAAWFFVGTAQTNADNAVEGMAPLSFTKTMGVVNSPIAAYLPGRLVIWDQYLSNHGLATNLVGLSSFSVNGIPTNSLPQITYTNGLVTVNFEGTTNLTATIERSTNMLSWRQLSRISAPSGAIIRFGDSEMPSSTSYSFWRVTVN